VGRQFAAALAQMGVKSCGEVSRYSEEFWKRKFGKAGQVLWARAQGIDPREVVPWTPPKSESAEVTLDEDTRDLDILRTWLLRHAERVGTSLRRHGLAGRTITLKIKYADFRQITRQVTLPQRVNSTKTIYDTAKDILDSVELADRVRLIGVGVSSFEEGGPSQLSLLPPKEPEKDESRRGKLDKAVDALRARYGREAVVRGRLFEAYGEDDDRKAASQAERMEADKLRK
jgi:DNA polymerase-4